MARKPIARKNCVLFETISEEDIRGGIILPENTKATVRMVVVDFGEDVTWMKKGDYLCTNIKKCRPVMVAGQELWAVKEEDVLCIDREEA